MRNLSLLLLLLLCPPLLRAQNIHASVPDSVDAEKFYMFYIHDPILNPEDMTPMVPGYGMYEYFEIVNRLATEGFTVISYPREKDTHPYLFAEETAGEVRKLLDAGVPPGHISIVGAGGGGPVAVVVTQDLQNPDINVILLATCTAAYVQYWIEHRQCVWGKVLSINQVNSKTTCSCTDWFTHCDASTMPLHREITLGENASPGFYLHAGPEWVLPTILWASGKYDVVRQ